MKEFFERFSKHKRNRSASEEIPTQSGQWKVDREELIEPEIDPEASVTFFRWVANGDESQVHNTDETQPIKPIQK